MILEHALLTGAARGGGVGSGVRGGVRRGEAAHRPTVPASEQWQPLLHPFDGPFPVVEHVATVLTADPPG